MVEVSSSSVPDSSPSLCLRAHASKIGQFAVTPNLSEAKEGGRCHFIYPIQFHAVRRAVLASFYHSSDHRVGWVNLREDLTANERTSVAVCVLRNFDSWTCRESLRSSGSHSLPHHGAFLKRVIGSRERKRVTRAKGPLPSTSDDDMDENTPTHFNVLIAGTGLVESILAAYVFVLASPGRY